MGFLTRVMTAVLPCLMVAGVLGHLSQLEDNYLDTTGHYTRIFAHQALEGAAF